MSNNPRHILVTGDVVIDSALFQGDAIHPRDDGSIAPHYTSVLGGAFLLAQIIKKAGLAGDVKLQTDFDLVLPAPPQDSQDAETTFAQPLVTSEPIGKPPEIYTLWHSCKGGTRKQQEEAASENKPKAVWRVKQSLGFKSRTNNPGDPLPAIRSSAAAVCPEVTVIADAGLGFNTERCRKLWPLGTSFSEDDPEQRWIVLKLNNCLGQGDLWRELTRSPAGADGKPPPACRKNLIVVTSAEEMRRAGAAITKGLSWERTLTELCKELHDNPSLRSLLLHSRHFIINFGCVGAVWFDNANAEKGVRSAPQHRAKLVYDPTLAEGEWKTLLADHHEVYGHLTTFTAAIVFGLIDETPDADGTPVLVPAIRRGLTAVRSLRLLGFGPSKPEKGETAQMPAFPFGQIALLLRSRQALPAKKWKDYDDAQKLVVASEYKDVLNPSFELADFPSWTLAGLTENPERANTVSPGCAGLDLPLYGLAHRVALYGLEALRCIPHARFGDLVSIDHYEIETLRGINQRMTSYEKGGPQKQPLCFAAFGPPGAGKSFGIKEIAKQVFGKDVPLLEFNLSQYDQPSDLTGAYHQVRDAVLKGRTPVVVWDEFDSRNYEWLQYLLAPMQDGTFQQDGFTHTLGKCIFVFAGGTSWDFEHFGPAPMPAAWSLASRCQRNFRSHDHAAAEADQLNQFYQAPGNEARYAADQAANQDFQRKKGPDFLSRLDGYINVLGPNRRREYDWSTRQWAKDDAADISFPVRRALLLRQFLEAKEDDAQLNIDRDLLRAFLLVPRYRHGARSLEKIAKPLVGSRLPYRKAHLPSPHTLSQHLDSLEIFDRIYGKHRPFLTSGAVPLIAEAIANYFGKKYKNETPQFLSKREPWIQETNLAAVRRYPHILALASLTLEASAGENTDDEVKKHLGNHMKTLAGEEHDLWMKFHTENGWSLATEAHLEEITVNSLDVEVDRLGVEKTLHSSMSPFKDISEEAKKGDYLYEFVRRILNEKIGKLRLERKWDLAESYFQDIPDEASKISYLSAFGYTSLKKQIAILKNEKRWHNLLMKFEKLPDSEKEKDYDAIGNFPDMAAKAGWRIVFEQPPEI